jgi:hypothetical protein
VGGVAVTSLACGLPAAAVGGQAGDSNPRIPTLVAAQYRHAGKREMRAMNLAVNRGPGRLRTRRRFDWFVSKANPRFGFVCGRKRGHVIGTPVRRPGVHGARWRVFAQSGAILLCPGSLELRVSEPRPLTGDAPVEGDGTDSHPFRRELTGGIDSWKKQCDEFKEHDPYGNFATCLMAFPQRSLSGFLTAEKPVPAYACPSLDPNPNVRRGGWSLENADYVPALTDVPLGVEVRGLGPVGIFIPNPSEQGEHQTSRQDSSATSWLTGTHSYQIVLHCTYDLG